MPARNPKWILFILLIAAPVVFAATDQPAPNDATKVEPAIRPVESSPTAYSLTALPAEKLARLTPLQVALRNVLLQEQADLALRRQTLMENQPRQDHSGSREH